MVRARGFRWGLVGIAAAAAVGLVVVGRARSAGSAEPCCFNNDAYGGMCTVVPGEGESCASILAYLNNPMSTGKSYCGGTSVRGGWARVNCSTGKPMACGDQVAALADARASGAPGRGGATR